MRIQRARVLVLLSVSTVIHGCGSSGIESSTAESSGVARSDTVTVGVEFDSSTSAVVTDQRKLIADEISAEQAIVEADLIHSTGKESAENVVSTIAPVQSTSKIADVSDLPGSTKSSLQSDAVDSGSIQIEQPYPVMVDVDDTETDVSQTLYERSGVDTITDLIFLTGQSNAASLVTKFNPNLDAPDSRVFAYTEKGWQIADLHQFWDEGIPGNFSADDPLREPYNNIIFQVGKALARSADRRVGIVMLTAPGEGISHWDHGGPFYHQLQNHAIAALNAVPHKSSFDALVWMQGETDWLMHGTADPDVADFESYQSDAYLNYYPHKLAGLIGALRSDPWFGESARFICTETIKADLNPHLMALNNDGDALTGCATASDLAARENDPHGNHFSAESLRVLGQRIADIYLQLLP